MTIGPDTTRIMGPLRANGTVDYITALNEKMGRGVDAERNAAVVLARVVGPDFAVPATWKFLWKSWDLDEPMPRTTDGSILKNIANQREKRSIPIRWMRPGWQSEMAGQRNRDF